MSNFLRSLFGVKKAAKVTKSKMQSRRLELLGLEERITPTVTASWVSGVLALTTTAGEDFSVIANADGTLSVNAGATSVTAGSGVTVTGSAGANTVTITTPSNVVLTTSLSLVGDATGNQDFTIAGINSAAYAANFGLSVDMGADTVNPDTLTFNTAAVTLKGTGALVTTNVDSISIAAAGDIVAATGAVGISAATITTAGDVTTTSGAITYTGAVTLSGNVATTSTLAGADLSFSSSLALSTFNFTASQGLGKASVTGAITGTGNLTISSLATPSSGSAISLAAVTAGAVSLTGAGDVSVTGAVLATSVNAKSTAGNVVFGSTVGTSAVGGFVSEATLATKATNIANTVTVAAGANALVTGNLVTTSATAGITVDGTATINITGKVDASANGNDLTLTALNGAITIGGAVGSSSSFTMGDLIASGNTSFTASGAVTVEQLGLNGTNKFGTSINFAEAVKVGGTIGARVISSGTGTINFAKTLESTASTSSIVLTSVNGALTVTGNITSKDDVTITSTGSGSITLSGAITTDAADGDILIETTSGNVVTSGAISTSGTASGGNSADIIIDSATSGNVTIGGNVSTSGGGDIILAADSATTATGAGNLTINGTVTTTGTTAGDIILGVSNGSAAVNKAVSAGATGDVVFVNNVATDSFTIASGANITAGDDVFDAFVTAAGIINLGANITALNDSSGSSQGITLDNSINLTGAVSMKAAGTSGAIGLASVNGAQNLTLEATGAITLGSVGQTTALNTVTVTNSGAGVSSTGLTAAKVVVSDTTGTVAFSGSTVITNSLTTAAKAYAVIFAGTSVLSGAPVFLNTGGVNFGSTGSGNTTSLTTGATITGNATSAVILGGTIVSGGAFNIGASGNTGVINIVNNTQLILNSTSAGSTFANPVDIAGGTNGKLSLYGVGSLTLSGDSSSSTVGDTIEVFNGTLNVTGKVANATSATNGTITGAGGTIGALTVNTGTVAPGGTLTTGAVTFNAATNYSAAVLSKTTASNLKTASAINLNGAALALTSVASGLAVGNSFTIIDNTATSGGLTGTFAGLPEGSSVSAKDASGNTVAFTISYKGGTNTNDVTLTVASVTPSQTATPQPMVAGQPALNKFTAVGADAGGGPLVTITFANGTYTSFFAYASTFRGGVRVALGDVNGDGSTDLITGAGVGGGPQVNVYNVNAQTGAVSLQSSFFAFSAPSFTGGVYVAAGHTNGDAFDDVIVGAGATGGSRVQVYAGSATGVVTSSTLNDFFAYSPAFTGGVVVAAGDRNADGDDEVITAPASNGGYNIKSFDCNGTGNSPTVVDNFFAFNNTTSVGGLSLAVGYFNSGGVADLVVGTSNGGYGVIVDSATSGIAGVPFAGFTGAIRAGVAEDSSGQDYAVALAGPTGGPRVSVFSVGATSLTETDNLFVMNPAFTGGLFGTPTLEENAPA